MTASATPAGSDRRRLRLLLLIPFAPRLDAPHGGRATASLVLRLAKRHDVALVCIRGEGEPPADDDLRSRCDLLVEVPTTRPSPGRWIRRVRQLGKPFGRPPNRVARAKAPGYAQRVSAVAGSWRPDIVQIELVETAQYLHALDECPAPRVLVDHDPGAGAAYDYSSAAAGLRRGWRRLDEVAWRRFSRRAFAAVDRVVVFTDRDRALVERLAAGVPVGTIPLSVELPERPLNPRGEEPPTVLFFGGYEHPPNADAAVRLMRTIFPRARMQHPELVLELVGERPTEEMIALVGQGIVLEGGVESLTPYLDRAAVVVAPLRLGGGMRVKVLETLAAGKALVASQRAVEGLPPSGGRVVRLAESDDEFCAAISELVADEDARVQLAREARRWAEANLGWERVAAQYESLYRELLAADT